MQVQHGPDPKPGVMITLDADELATAVHAYLVAHGVHIEGPRTTRVNGEFCESASVYVDPSGWVEFEGRVYNGSGT